MFRQGRYEEATRRHGKVIKAIPHFYEMFYGKGDALFRQGKYEEAIKRYQKAIRIDSAFYDKGNGLIISQDHVK